MFCYFLDQMGRCWSSRADIKGGGSHRLQDAFEIGFGASRRQIWVILDPTWSSRVENPGFPRFT